MPFLPARDGVMLHYALHDYTDPWTDAPVLFLQHGFGRNARLWFNMIPTLGRFYRVVCPDMRGLGGSSRDFDLTQGFTLDNLLSDVLGIADALGAAQLTSVIALAPDGAVIHASRAGVGGLHTVRIRGAAVLGVRIAGPAIDEYPTPMPSATMRRLTFSALGLDPAMLAHRTLAPRAAREPHRTVESVVAHLAVHVLPRQGR